MSDKLKLQANTEYVRGDGTEVRIAGLARHDPIDGQLIYWSVAGDWYAEDGRFVWYGPVKGSADPVQYKHSLLPATSHRTIREVLV